MTRNDIKREYPDRPISAVAGVVIQNDFVLLVKKSNTENVWSFPGGAIEIGETLHEALIREILEETSIKIEVTDQIENVNVIKKDENDEIKIHYVLSFYMCKYVSGQPQFGDDVVAAEWHKINKINEIKLIDGASRILAICGY